MSDLYGNQLLDQIAGNGAREWLADLKRVDLHFKETLFECGERLRYVYFPETAVVALAAMAPGPRCVELALVGREGMVGLAPVLQGKDTLTDAIVQIPGNAWRLETRELQHCCL